jgi:hypothetical protein
MLKNKIFQNISKYFFIFIHKKKFEFFFEKFNIFIDNMLWYYQTNVFCGKFFALL